MEMVTLKQASDKLGVDIDLLRQWEKKGLVKSVPFSQADRLFKVSELQTLQNGKKDKHKFHILKSRKTSYTAIELFAGCGGLALGFENAGFNSQLLVEIDKDAVQTLIKNRPKWNVRHDDVRDVDFSEFENHIDIVSGGFPCQAFSYAGKGLGFGDTRGTLFFEFLRCVRQVRPKIALGENVRGLLKHDNGRTLATMIHELENEGYTVKVQLLKAQFLDVPQKRERLIILGIRNDLDVEHLFPKPKDYTISLRETFDYLDNCEIELSDRYEGYQYSEAKYKVMDIVPAGGCWRDLPIDIQKQYMKGSFHLSGGKTGMARRLSLDEPSLTLTCNPAQKQTERCHPIETRPLSVREYAIIQTFPNDWEFVGSLSSRYKQIGNAVPVNLGYHIGRALIALLSGKNTTEFIKAESISPVPQMSLTF